MGRLRNSVCSRCALFCRSWRVESQVPGGGNGACAPVGFCAIDEPGFTRNKDLQGGVACLDVEAHVEQKFDLAIKLL